MRPIALRPRFVRAAFEDVPALLRLISRSLDHASSRACYRPEQRRAIHLSYAASLFADVVGPFETVVAEVRGEPVGVAQLDPHAGRLRGLFVDSAMQGQGIGRLLLAHIESRAARRGCAALQGAMSTNAVQFYTRAGYRPTAGSSRLLHFGVSVPVVPMRKEIEITGSGSRGAS